MEEQHYLPASTARTKQGSEGLITIGECGFYFSRRSVEREPSDGVQGILGMNSGAYGAP